MIGSGGSDLSREGDTASGDPLQLATDAKVWDSVASAGFCGPLYDRLVDRLGRYAMGTVLGAAKSGRLFGQCRQRTGLDLCRPCTWTPEDQEEVASATVASALRRFDKLARTGSGWSPERGATLATYFYGLCLDAFPNEFRAWLRYIKRGGCVELSETGEIARPRGGDLADAMAARLDLRRDLSTLPDEQRHALLLQFEGYSAHEIGVRLGRTSRSVEGLIYRARERLKKRDAGGVT
jgi:DNA-directed RNA polymerase specialized sigma24 family protein